MFVASACACVSLVNPLSICVCVQRCKTSGKKPVSKDKRRLTRFSTVVKTGSLFDRAYVRCAHEVEGSSFWGAEGYFSLPNLRLQMSIADSRSEKGREAVEPELFGPAVWENFSFFSLDLCCPLISNYRHGNSIQEKSKLFTALYVSIYRVLKVMQRLQACIFQR